MVNEATMTMEVELTLEEEIQEGQLEDAKLNEIRQLIRDNKISDFLKDSQGTLWLGKCICVPNLKHIKELILREAHDLAYSINPGTSTTTSVSVGGVPMNSPHHLLTNQGPHGGQRLD
jgi:hypothetical protein